jgi:uncharacterized protein (TIGR03118 family)
MKQISRGLGPAAVIAITIIATTAVRADDGNRDNEGNRYVVTNLVSDIAALGGQVIDPNLKNAWGVAFSPAASPFWIADNATGLSTLYDGAGNIVNLVVTIPCPTHPPGQGSSCPQTAAPTGMVWNASSAFLVPGTTNSAASFIWATEDGTISAWTGGLTPNPNNARLAVDNSVNPTATTGAVYKGLVFGTNVHGVFLFATNFRAGTIDAFAPNGSTGYRPATAQEVEGTFTDPKIPQGFAPFGIQNINGDLFVTYAKQNTPKHDDVAGPGNGFVDVFDTNGHLLHRFASRGQLNSPWGVARASFAFGGFSGDILVGNFGNGQINAFDSDGDFLGTLRDVNGKPVAIDGLWTLTLGGGRNSSSDTLYFTAGPTGETDGLFGTITPASKNDDD